MTSTDPTWHETRSADYIDIEIFPCAGGMGEGFRRAGIEFDLMIELEEIHCDSYEANLGHRPTTMDARSFLELLQMGWRPPKPVRMLVADPPCTPWSRAGKRLGQDDPRDMLEGTCRIISILKPQVYLIGNVPGLDDGPNLPIVQRTIGALSKHGYCTADFARLDAANYGVPQHRIRPFWFGHQHGPCVQWPAPTHGDPSELNNLVLPGVDVLLPWVSCAKALGHLPPEELGRPIKLRRRNQNGVQQGSAPEQPARVVGTSNLSDGNVLIPPDAPRSGDKKRRDKYPRTPQADRMNQLDEPSATVTRNGGRARMGASSTLSLLPNEAPMRRGRKRDEGRTPQGLRTRDAERPSAVVTAKPARAGAGESSMITVRPGDHAMSRPDKPARTLTRNTHSDGAVIVRPLGDCGGSLCRGCPKCCETFAPCGRCDRCQADAAEDNAQIDTEPAFVGSVDELVAHLRDGDGDEMFPPSQADQPSNTIRAMGREMYLEGMDIGQYEITEDERAYIVENRKHPPSQPDQPAPTLGAKQRGQGAQVVLVTPNHPASDSDGPSNTIRATTGGGSNRALEWPAWTSERTATTIQRDERLAPPGHHGQSFMSDADAVVISEKAAAILQGFPETWVFMGDSKKARWSQIGQAMPPPLAHAVANSVVDQLRKTETSD